MKIIERIVKSPGAPSSNDLWLDISKEQPVLKAFIGGKWKSLGSAGSSSDESIIEMLQKLTDAEMAQVKTILAIPSLDNVAFIGETVRTV